MDAAVVTALREEGVAVGGAQLLDLPVAQERVDDGVLAAQLLERRRVGGEPCLRLLLGLEAELVEQDGAELLGRVDDEPVAGELLDLLLEPVGLDRELARQLAQVLDVDAHAHLLHPRQHAHQRALDVVVEAAEAPGLERLAESGRQAGDRHRAPGGVLRRGAGVAGEVELAGGRRIG